MVLYQKVNKMPKKKRKITKRGKSIKWKLNYKNIIKVISGK